MNVEWEKKNVKNIIEKWISRFRVMEKEEDISKGNGKEVFIQLRQEQGKCATLLIREEKSEIWLTSQKGK